MTASPLPPQWRSFAASSLVDVLIEDEDIGDVGALTGDHVPGWLRRLGIPKGWRRVELSDKPEVPLAQMAVYGPRGDGGWEAAETISVFGYTGWPAFYELIRNADRTLRALDATDIATIVLPIPPTRWAAAIRSSGVALIGGRRVWLQQSNYVAGSEQPHAGRLVVHSVFVDAQCRARLAEDIAQTSETVYQGFVATLSNAHRAG